ncbi:hypothetical protein [Kocuria arenosa]|uniref:hypothetical protein n=1 Tax=Kocuria arenosa TaxID=3071446 RepID=UPI0034D78771
MYSTVRPVRRTQLSLLAPARASLYLGLFAVSLMVFRVGGAITVGDVFLVAAVGLTVADSVANGRRLPTSSVVAFALVFVGGLLASLVSTNPGASAAVLARVVLLAFLVPWCMGVLLSTSARIRRAVVWFGAGAAVCGAGAIAQSVGVVVPGSEVTSGGRFPGFAVHVSDTGGITCLAVVYGAGLFLARGRRAVGVVMFGVGLAGLILSGSVSGMISALIGILGLLVWHRLSLPKALGIGVVLAGAAAWAITLMSSTENALTPTERYAQVTGATGTGNTTASRWDSIEAGLRGFVDSTFIGVGLEPAASFTATGLPAHNFLVASLFQGGALFTVGVCLVIYRAIRRGLRLGWVSSAHATLGAGMITALAFTMTAPSVYNRYFWVPLAFAVLASRAPQQKPLRRDLVVAG